MCGISGIFAISPQPIEGITGQIALMNRLQEHRGPDDGGVWVSSDKHVGLGHRRLSIIDLHAHAHQPMTSLRGDVVSFNGEIYNYQALRQELAPTFAFKTHSDTETLLAAYERWGEGLHSKLRGMFAFAIFDKNEKSLILSRDRFGIKPVYYALINNIFYFASEAKALLPFLPEIATSKEALSEYLVLQYTLGEQTLFKHIKQVPPGHYLKIKNGKLRLKKYWDVHYEIDFEHTEKYFSEKLEYLLNESVKTHLVSDVPVGTYLSGGIDSSIVSLLADQHTEHQLAGCFHGRYVESEAYDESAFANQVAAKMGYPLYKLTICAEDFQNSIADIIYHLDFPVAGPGAFGQYHVARFASQHVKVILGGQGGDEIFGGYARYTLAYFEQCIKAAIEGTHQNGNFVVTPESIIPNLGILKEYKPLIQEFWREGLFGPLDERYFRLADRSNDMLEEVDWTQCDKSRVKALFFKIFNGDNVGKEAYFDKMTHYDFKCQIPALLHVEDRMSMAHGLETRVPFLDHPLIEFLAKIPADIKFKGGKMKYLLKNTFRQQLPPEVMRRRDKMGFPVPLREWFKGELSGFIKDIFSHSQAKERPFVFNEKIVENIMQMQTFSRKAWGLLSLELWQQTFHDKGATYQEMARHARSESTESLVLEP